MNRDQVLAVYGQHLAAELAHDHEGAAATYLDDCYYEYVPLGIRLEGRPAVALNYAMSYASVPDVAFEIDHELVDGERLVHWGRMTGTVTGEYLGQAPSGRRLNLPFVGTFEFRDGAMLGEQIFFDLATLCDQAGFDLAEVKQWVEANRALFESL